MFPAIRGSSNPNPLGDWYANPWEPLIQKAVAPSMSSRSAFEPVPIVFSMNGEACARNV